MSYSPTLILNFPSISEVTPRPGWFLAITVAPIIGLPVMSFMIPCTSGVLFSFCNCCAEILSCTPHSVVIRSRMNIRFMLFMDNL